MFRVCHRVYHLSGDQYPLLGYDYISVCIRVLQLATVYFCFFNPCSSSYIFWTGMNNKDY